MTESRAGWLLKAREAGGMGRRVPPEQTLPHGDLALGPAGVPVKKRNQLK